MPYNLGTFANLGLRIQATAPLALWPDEQNLRFYKLPLYKLWFYKLPLYKAWPQKA